ncbi:MAG: alpha-L-rhamnosidase C-terminal domain-containing protein [Candidatus Cyclobacteriaceae bacterium M3_2C_046]
MNRKSLVIFLIFISIRGWTQEHLDQINPDLLQERWQAQWIQHPEADANAFGVYHFRKSFELEKVPEQFMVHVSADNRYTLFVNGKQVCFGPARGDRMHWYFETVDLKPFLRKGTNLLAAQVWNFADHRPLAQITYQTAFILQGNRETEAIVNTDNTWKVMQNQSYQPIPVDWTMIRGYYAVGATEKVDGAKYPWGWQNLDYDDGEWLTPKNIGYGGQGVPFGFKQYSAMSAWQLLPRDIPMMTQQQERILKIIRTNHEKIHPGFIRGSEPLIIPANSQVSILLDQTYLTTTYPELVVDKGKNSEIRITYAEALVDDDFKKGNRNITTGKKIFGIYDIFYPEGKEVTYRPLWTRTYRYLQLDITTREQPLEIKDLYGIYTAYPFEEQAVFATGSEKLDQIWQVGWRTAKLCATETYMDCPYYEQLQYVGDTRLQALISLLVAGDDRLMRKAIKQFYWSMYYEGITLSRHPTYIPQVTPTYSLIWVMMVHDFMMYRDDPDFIKQFLPAVKNILQWFERYLDHTDLLGPLPWVNYMDAAEGFTSGTPPYLHEGHSIQISLLFSLSLDHAAEIFELFDQSHQADQYSGLSSRLKKAAYQSGYNSQTGLMAETPAQKYWTQHTNILAILTDAIPAEEQQALMKRILTDEKLIQAEIYFQYYLFQAMKKSGLGNEYLNHLDKWEYMLNKGLTTFAEHTIEARSDCHAWSAHPIIDFINTVAGVNPAQPGFKKVVIQPHMGILKQLKTVVPHPLGLIKLELERTGNDGVQAIVWLPDNLYGTFVWKEQEKTLKPGQQRISFK